MTMVNSVADTTLDYQYLVSVLFIHPIIAPNYFSGSLCFTLVLFDSPGVSRIYSLHRVHHWCDDSEVVHNAGVRLQSIIDSH